MDVRTTLAAGVAVLLLGASPDADAAFKAGNFADARAGYAAVVAKAPQDVNALLGLATTELYDNQLDRARADVERALKIDATNERAKRIARTIAIRAGRPGEFQISQAHDVALPFRSEDPLPMVTMKINGVAAHVVIDTGAPAFVLTGAFAKAHGFKIRDAGMGTFAGGRQAPIEETTIDDISADGLSVRNVPASVMEGPGLSSPSGTVDAIIGTAFFSHFLTTIDYPRHQLLLRAATNASPDRSTTSVPMWFVGDHFVFARAQIDGGAPALFLIDTGSDIAVNLTKATLTATGIAADGKPEPFMGGGGETTVIPVTVPSLQLGDVVQRSVRGVTFPEGDPLQLFPFTAAGIISGGFFKDYAVTFDFRSMQLVLSR